MKLWIRVDASTARDPNVGRFAEALGVSVPTAVGHLVMLWGVMAEHTPDGIIESVGVKALEEWAGWRGKRGRFAQAFTELFVTHGVVNGWADWQGKLIERMERDRARKRRGDSAETRRNSAPTVRNVTEQDKEQEQDQQQKPSAPRARGKRERSRTRNGATPESPPDAPSPDTAPSAARDRVTWLTPAREAWERHNGPGSFTFGQAAKLLAPLRQSGLAPEVIGERLARYCAERVTGFCTLADFAQHHARWSAPPPEVPDLDALGWMSPELERETRPPGCPPP
ncbi:MAG TPA: hypothetical protein VFS44_02325 [Gemmatimonadaceae bacterium]|nr:hypothetical protein [Gemmatimonadaceae bacterium]